VFANDFVEATLMLERLGGFDVGSGCVVIMFASIGSDLLESSSET
jgi:hypothetical protein